MLRTMGPMVRTPESEDFHRAVGKMRGGDERQGARALGETVCHGPKIAFTQPQTTPPSQLPQKTVFSS
jgi:hypothetical protein